jgi:putative iron-dependent peroxidase
VLITEADEPAFAGGSYVVVQKYVHDLAAWDALPVEEQEQAIGREKLSDIEFDDDDKAPNAHLTLNTIVDADGAQQQIMRFNMPFGRVGAAEFGTYYIAYARTPGVLEEMLTNMFIGKPPGTYDRILDFSTAVTGNLFFTPTVDFLDDPPAPPGAGGSPEEPTAAAEGDGGDSLGIGSLRPSS